MHTLTLALLPERYAVCRLPADSALPSWLPDRAFYCVIRTPQELSLVCEEALAPRETRCERGWRLFRFEGPFAFHLTGILASVAGPLAEARISIFALSSYDTDFVLVPDSNVEKAVKVLTDAGHRIVR